MRRPGNRLGALSARRSCETPLNIYKGGEEGGEGMGEKRGLA